MNAEPHDTEAHAGDKPPARGTLLIGAGIALAGAVGIYALTQGGESAGSTTPEEAARARAQAVTVSTATEETFTQSLTLAGEARPRRDVRVFAPASGVRVLELLVDEGAFVRAGQPLARLDTTLANAQTAAAAAAVKEAEVGLQRARAEAERAESIRASGALSAEAIETRVAQAAAAEARLAAARAQLAEVNARLQGGYVRAPAAGLVIERTAQIGALVDGNPLFRIAGDNALEVAAEIGEADMLLMKVGQPVTFRLVDGTPIEARLRRPPAAIDSRTRTGEALFDLPRHPKLRAGMFLRGEAELPGGRAIAAPLSAVVFDGPEAAIFVLDQNDVARRRPVFVGARQGDRIAIQRGLSAGERFVAGGAVFLQDGDRVRPVEAGAPAAPAVPKASVSAAKGG